jgi:hypothetical protein
MAPPKTHHDLAIVAKEQRVTSLDNLSKMSPEMSDALARMSTGSTIANRGLYTDGEVAAFSVRGACLLNGIPDVINKADLAERTLTLVLQRPIHRKLDAEVKAGFQEDWPKLLAALCDGLVGVLAYEQDVINALDRERAPRMVDPFVWAEAAGRVWDWKPWQLLDDLEHAQYDAAASLMESDPVARAVIKAVTDWCKRKNAPEWKGQANELLDIARIAAQDLGASTEYFPTSPRGMASSMRRIAPPLRLLGWTVDNRWEGRDRDRAPRWSLRPPQT